MSPKKSYQSLTSIAIIVTATALTGCTTTTESTQSSGQKIYFSHAIDNLSTPDFDRQGARSPKSVSNVQLGPSVVLHFDNDSAIVRSEDVERLQSFLLSFSTEEMPQFLVTGHTDSNHTDRYNIELADRRAKSTRSQMQSMGVPLSNLSLKSLGESTPVSDNLSESGRQENRRVTVTLIE
ncbi:MAG: OmpA family protein [Oceanospirillaceae bacterium]|nr:OmpA family protein [Oceanospirillaceae bacterium]